MKQKIQHLAKTQMETGKTPSTLLKGYPNLQRALKLINRMDTGVEYSIEDLTYRELRYIDLVKSEMDKVRNQKLRKKQQEMNAGGKI